MATLIKDCDLLCLDGIHRRDVLLQDGKVSQIAENIDVEAAEEVIPAEGLTLIPGLVDLHVHFREPGFSYKETIATGCAAAEAGGFTTVCTMPNLNPAPDSPEHLEEQLRLIRQSGSPVQVLPYATITRLRMGDELVDYTALAPYVAGFSDDGSGVQSEEVMRKAMEGIVPTGKVLAAHCEVNALLRGGYIHDGEYARMHGHRGICSESEWREIERDIRLAAETGCRLHICHISTAEGVRLVRCAQQQGLPVTCETGPHYLWFADYDLQEDGRFKMNPPIRSLKDREALIEGLLDGTISAIATDHAPHSAEEKAKGLEKSAMGVVGLETSFGASYTEMCLLLGMSLADLVRVMAINPRRILGLEGFEQPAVQVGDPATLTLVDLNAKYRVDPSTFKSMGKATPFEGKTLQGLPVKTIIR